MSVESPNIIFSDVDGTLVHYPKHINNFSEPGNKILFLPPSTTGMKGIISSKTLKICQDLRRHGNSKLVLVSGMRTETLIKRLPYLPKADAYASEAGGRIFYPVKNLVNYKGGIIEPQKFDGALDTDLDAFGLEEDMEWRDIISRSDAAGSDGYVGDVMDLFLNRSQNETTIPIENRKGLLWDFARELQDQGFRLDYKGYASCFRVNKSQQNEVSDEDFISLSILDVSVHGLGSSVNLGCVDFYPIQSGKKNCCAYIASKLLQKNSVTYDSLLQNCMCLCDDDNDLEMALACGKAFLPSISSESMMLAVKNYPNKLILFYNMELGISDTKATEAALMAVMKEIKKN